MLQITSSDNKLLKSGLFCALNNVVKVGFVMYFVVVDSGEHWVGEVDSNINVAGVVRRRGVRWALCRRDGGSHCTAEEGMSEGVEGWMVQEARTGLEVTVEVLKERTMHGGGLQSRSSSKHRTKWVELHSLSLVIYDSYYTS